MAFFVDFELHKCSRLAADAVEMGFTIGAEPENPPPIPSPDIFSLESSPKKGRLDSRKLPPIHDCAVHLELLHSIHRLRNAVQSSSAIQFIGQRADESKQYNEVRAARWSVYLRAAVVRFLLWLGSGEMLPPLDIVMVWHACLLNPVFFSEFCSRRGHERIRYMPFPWKEIHAAIDPEKRTFQLGRSREEAVEGRSKIAPDFLSLLQKNERNKILEQLLASIPTGTALPEGSFPSALPLGNAVAVLLDKCVKACGTEQLINEIAAAVNRQYSFVEKMEQHLWLRSPAPEGTLRSATERYDKLVKLLKWHPKTMLVPTLDVDLVWHTHQCAGTQYQADMEQWTGKFIDHNDKVGPPVLKGGESKTREFFRLHFDCEYMRCLCWDCEAILSELEKARLSGHKLDHRKRRDMARNVASVVSYCRSTELAYQTAARAANVE
ncbi:hypothetical protein IWX48DRAFT_164987 [Phyllosticta citricarpa]